MEMFDAIILGAGIVGAACACECAASGLRVVVKPGCRPGEPAPPEWDTW